MTANTSSVRLLRAVFGSSRNKYLPHWDTQLGSVFQESYACIGNWLLFTKRKINRMGLLLAWLRGAINNDCRPVHPQRAPRDFSCVGLHSEVDPKDAKVWRIYSHFKNIMHYQKMTCRQNILCLPSFRCPSSPTVFPVSNHLCTVCFLHEYHFKLHWSILLNKTDSKIFL